MRAVLHLFAKLIVDRKAATAVEYGLIVSLIVLALIAGINSLASTTTNMWNNVSTKVQEAR